MSNNRSLRAFVKYDSTGKIVPSSLTLAQSMPKVGRWQEINAYPTQSPTTTIAPGPPTVLSATGRIWMDRNLGASQVATSLTDVLSYGDYYQWGRLSDGHQLATSATTSTLSNSDVPGNSDFIISPCCRFDWLFNRNNNLWQGVNGINNPCPAGFRLPTSAELQAEVNIPHSQCRRSI